MNRPRLSCALLALLLFSAGTALARPSSTGETDVQQQISDHLSVMGSCSVLWYGTASGDEIVRLQGMGLTITQTTNSADLAIANLANYDVLVVAYTGPGSIAGAQPDITAFVGLGRGLLIHQPNAVGTLDYAPTGFDATISSVLWCGGGAVYDTYISDGTHPITSGLANSDLAGDFDSVSGLGAGYSVLARNVSCNTPALAAGTSGTGRIAFETGNANVFALDPGSDLYWTRLFDWLCNAGGPVGTEQSTWGGLKAGYR